MPKKKAFIVIGIFILFTILLLLPPPEGMPVKAWNMVAVVVLIASLWITEAINLSVTALLPIVLLPILNITSASKVTLSYANDAIFLFLGGFMIAITVESSNLHKRFALYTIKLIGSCPTRLILGFMLVVYALSMWVSNTATVLMIIPICIAITDDLPDSPNIDYSPFKKALLLAIAYAASIGGVATLIGTPPNIILTSILSETEHISISFAKWMTFAVPTTLILLILCWLLLVYGIFKVNKIHINIDKRYIEKRIAELGKMSNREKRVLIIFSLIAFLWIFRGLVPIDFFQKTLSDTTIAIAGAVTMFLVSSGTTKGETLLTWEKANRLPWNILLLSGGGIALSNGFKNSGLSDYMAASFDSMTGLNPVLLLIIIVTAVVFLTEIMSNTATATLLIPIAITLSNVIGVPPLSIVIPITMATSFAFMLPVATPPNAIVFGHGYLKITDMVKAGFWLNIISIIVLVLMSTYLLPLLFT